MKVPLSLAQSFAVRNPCARPHRVLQSLIQSKIWRPFFTPNLKSG